MELKQNIWKTVIPSLKEQKPDIIVIHVGGNGINYKNKGNANVNELADNIINLAVICGDIGVPDIAISEVLPTKNIAVTAIIRKANDQVRELGKNNKFRFISHHHITRNFLHHDGIHLTDPGTEILADNIVDYINNFILWQNLPNNEENTTDSSEQGNDYLDMKNKNYSNIFFNTFSSISELIELRNKYPKSPIIVYLNINSLRNKIIDLREKMSKASLVIVCIDKTKLDESFPASQFLMENYHQFPPFRRDRNSKGGGKLGFVKNGLTAKRVKETNLSGTICIEFNFEEKVVYSICL